MLVCLARRLSIDDDVPRSATPRAQTLTLLLLHSSPVLIVTIAWRREALQRFNLAILTSAPTFVDLLATASTSTKPRLLLDTDTLTSSHIHTRLFATPAAGAALYPLITNP
jgi:hypothetical protein